MTDGPPTEFQLFEINASNASNIYGFCNRNYTPLQAVKAPAIIDSPSDDYLIRTSNRRSFITRNKLKVIEAILYLRYT